MAINKIMVVGAGQMGGGIAQVAAASGLQVILNDIDGGFIDKRLAFIDKLLSRNVDKGRISEEQRVETMARLTPSTDLADAADADFIVEAASENMAIK
jgi:3-hydroxybutyryl-CoA dehydrogenase